MHRCLASFALVIVLLVRSPGVSAQTSIYLEELTWTEVRDAIKAGKTTVIFPTGGTEQNGPHMVLGKHNFVIHYTAGEIAKRLGNALVAPVLPYVPEGSINPPSGHMRMAGTITLPNDFFMKVTEWAARSFKVHGFTDIVFIGDSGGNQAGLKEVAEQLNKEWAGSRTRVYFVPDYYSGTGFDAWLLGQGEKKEDIGTHAGITDTSQLMAIDASFLRPDKFAANGGYEGSGVTGNPTRASVAYGKKGLELKIEAGVRQIRALVAAR
jgi:creatinine amidohydrolase/Fe(II)-dependent formamide hydrolase-like protein